MVGQKLRAAAKDKQILCVTHLAQVAAQAHVNYHVEKTADKNITHVSITPLTDENLIIEIARMLGGSAKTSAAFTHAQELLAQAGRSVSPAKK